MPATPDAHGGQRGGHPEVVLGFDYGRRRIGIALGSKATQTAQPLDTLDVRNGIDWTRIAALVDEWAPDILVVGLPLHEDGGEHEISTEAQRFARRLEGRFLRPTVLVDERLSSHEAQNRLREFRGQRRGRRANSVSPDSVAACLILETWLS